MIEEILVFGLIQGSLLALLALGFSLVYGVGGILNLAHGAFFLMAAYIMFWTIPYFGVYIAATISLVAIVGIGAVTYLGLIGPLRETPLGVVLVTFALAFFLEQFVKFFGGSRTHIVNRFITGNIEILGISLPIQLLLLIGGSLILVTIVTLFISKSTIGKSIRAVSQDFEAAQLMGINTNMILLLSVMLSALLVGFAAVLYVPANFLAPRIGWGVLISAFAVTIFGGMGSIPGSILGAYIMGFATTFTDYLISPAFSELIPIVVIVVMLLVRPQGLLGKEELD